MVPSRVSELLSNRWSRYLSLALAAGGGLIVRIMKQLGSVITGVTVNNAPPRCLFLTSILPIFFLVPPFPIKPDPPIPFIRSFTKL